MKISFLNVFLVLLLGYFTPCYGQRDIPMSLKIVSPNNNMEVHLIDTIKVSVEIENLSKSESLLKGDTVLFRFSDNLELFPYLLKEDFLAGQKYKIDSLTSQSVSLPSAIELDFCIRIYGTYNSTVEGAWSNPNRETKYCSKILVKERCNTTFSSITELGCNEYISPSRKYVWNTSGSYQDTIKNSIGCDSVITIELAIEKISLDIRENDGILISEAENVNYQWINCKNDLEIYGANEKEYKPNEDGEYAVILSTENCIINSKCYSYNLNETNIEHVNSNVFLAYPNPAKDNLYIQLNTSSRSNIVSIFNIFGQKIYSQIINNSFINIDISLFSKGLYRVQLSDEHNSMFEQTISVLE